MRKDILTWHKQFRKPVMVSEFGADSVAGVHSHPSVAFSEEFQSDYLAAHFGTFDELRKAGIFIGEHVWNFADFMTSQGVTRVVGNRKGVFTRGRQPKLAAHTVRSRYLQLANTSKRWPLSLGSLSLEGGGSSSSSEVRAVQARTHTHLPRTYTHTTSAHDSQGARLENKSTACALCLRTARAVPTLPHPCHGFGPTTTTRERFRRGRH